MSKFSFKKLLLIGTTYVVTAAIAIGSTVAFLQDDDFTINVMAAGNVSVRQLVYERDTAATGSFKTFTQEKPLYPAVFSGEIPAFAEKATSWETLKAPGSNRLYHDNVKNVNDMFAFVENVSENAAFVRTWFAFEQGSLSPAEFEALIVTNKDDVHWSWGETKYDVEITDHTGKTNKYAVVCATYLGSSTDAGVLARDAVSYPSLLQVYMSSAATNADCAAADGNANGYYDVLVYSQAVQADGFAQTNTSTEPAKTPLETANYALSTAFSDDNPWTNFTWPTVLAAYRSAEQGGWASPAT